MNTYDVKIYSDNPRQECETIRGLSYIQKNTLVFMLMRLEIDHKVIEVSHE